MEKKYLDGEIDRTEYMKRVGLKNQPTRATGKPDACQAYTNLSVAIIQTFDRCRKRTVRAESITSK